VGGAEGHIKPVREKEDQKPKKEQVLRKDCNNPQKCQVQIPEERKNIIKKENGAI